MVPETDVNAVRIMTIHASKGLEFPMVIVAGTGSSPRTSSDAALWDKEGGLHVSLKEGITSARYRDAKEVEKLFDEAEKRRLLYVACTRAESHLVISHYVNRQNSLGQLLKNTDDPGIPSLALPTDIESGATRTATVKTVEPWNDWDQQRTHWQEQSAIVSTASVTSIAKGMDPAADGEAAGEQLQFVPLDDETLPSPAPADAERGAEFGTALHRVMELSDLKETADIETLAESIARLASKVTAAALASRARAALASEPVRRASDREHWLELPVVAPTGEVTVEGVIDLMYREDDGSLVIADFKTDSEPTSETVTSYWRQLSTYADMIERM